jgi:hypothetical protein
MPYAANEADSTQYAATGTTLNVLRTNPDVIPVVWTEVPFVTLDTVPDWKSRTTLPGILNLVYYSDNSTATSVLENIKNTNQQMPQFLAVQFYTPTAKIYLVHKNHFYAVDTLMRNILGNKLDLDFRTYENPNSPEFLGRLAYNYLSSAGVPDIDISAFLGRVNSVRQMPGISQFPEFSSVAMGSYTPQTDAPAEELHKYFNSEKCSLWFDAAARQYQLRNTPAK